MILKIVFVLTAGVIPPSLASETRSTLILGLDGISYAVFNRMRDGGYFRMFKTPAPMISSFPSISDPNWAMITGSEPTQSYTKEHFDTGAAGENGGHGKVVGSIIDHLSSPPAFEKIFDFKPEGVLEHLVTVAWRETSALVWLDSLEKEFEKANYPKRFFAFNMNTDLMSHTKGDKVVLPYLLEIDRRLQKIMLTFKKKFGTDLEVVMISDHGNAYPGNLKAAPIREHMEKKGWKVVPTLNGRNQVAYVIPEMISFAGFYCSAGDEEKLARDISASETVHVTLIKTGLNQVDFFSDNGKNHTRTKVDPDKKQVSYQVISGNDPFNQMHLFKKGSLSWSNYLLESVKMEYPYALVRSWQSFFLSVRQPSSVLVSPKEIWVFGSPQMQIVTSFTGLVGTHGSFHRDQTLGLFVSTAREFPPISADQFTSFVPLK